MNKKSLMAAAQAATEKFFTMKDDQQESASESPQTAQEGRQDVQTGESSGNTKDAQKGVKTAKKAISDPVKVFSFRGTVRDVDQWRLYASIRGVKVDEIGVAAMREYLKRHPLSAEEKALFDKRVENMDS